ncbi:hypothetical protein RhiirA4_472407 [Rhizophagus irregularis]|uniref:Uncharacterized protein n=1 Tax=Rhizophagus irregularis TaxID=588596 RepID=A0A2I1H4X2_9GLOM|nr:hypothetical protein RhiirA4_472407 [Rhizophagus irregularis]
MWLPRRPKKEKGSLKEKRKHEREDKESENLKKREDNKGRYEREDMSECKVA